MLLEQLIDYLFWCLLRLLFLISEIRCPSRQKTEEQQQREGKENINVCLLTDPEHNFEYKEFPETISEERPESEDDAEVLLSAANHSVLSNNNVSPEIRSTWIFPHKSERGPLLPSIVRSFPTCSTIFVSAIVISGISGFFAYLDMETTDKCIGIESHQNTTIPAKVLKWKLIGESFQALLLNFWFPATFALLFNGRVFLTKFKSLLYIGLITGLLIVICKSYLFVYYGSHFQDSKYRYPGNAIFFIGVILSCVEIARVTGQSAKSIVLKLGQIFMFSMLMYLGYRNLIVPWFNEQTNEINKVMIAAIIPIFALIPVAVGKYVVLYHCTAFVEAEVSFVLIYFNYLIPVALYRIMQAELTDLGLFVAFSVIHGAFNLIVQVG